MTKALKANNLFLDRSLFTSPCYLAVAFNQEEYDIVRKKLNPQGATEFPAEKGTAAMTHQFMNEDGELAVLITFNVENASENKTVSLTNCMAFLTHECTHVKQIIMEAIGEKMPSREFEAYMMQHIMQHVIQAFILHLKAYGYKIG